MRLPRDGSGQADKADPSVKVSVWILVTVIAVGVLILVGEALA
jgi:hypothetical protein